MKAGAYDLMEKPYNIEELSLIIDNALEKKIIAQDRDIMSNKLALLEMTRTITSTIEYHKLLDKTIEIIFSTLKADSCSLMGYDETENVLRIEAALGLPEKVIKETVIKPGERVAGWVFYHNSQVHNMSLRPFPQVSPNNPNLSV